MMFIIPVLNGSNQAIWQAKVIPEVQGRVFSVRRFVAGFTAPISMAIAGPLADRVFEPAMVTDGHWMNNLFGSLFGTVSGSGMSFIIFICGILTAVVGLISYRVREIREVEVLIPDYDAQL